VTAWRVIASDCLEALAGLPDASVDAVVTDPPYGLEFMGEHWDREVPGADYWREVLRVAKPGAHLLAFAGTRTLHRMASAIEDAGWQVRDLIAWLYGQGFPKGLDVARAIDRLRHDRDRVLEVTAWVRAARDAAGITNAQIDAAFGFNGMAGHWTTSGTQPAVPTLDHVPRLLEVLGGPEVPPAVARLLVELNGAKGEPGESWFRREVVGRKTGGIVPDPERGPTRTVGGHSMAFDVTAPASEAARSWAGWNTVLKPAIEPVTLARKPLEGTVARNVLAHGVGAINVDACRVPIDDGDGWDVPCPGADHNGRRPGIPNGTPTSGRDPEGFRSRPAEGGRYPPNVILDDAAASELDAQAGEPVSRFFYVPKPTPAERDAGLGRASNTHPTVKPVALMRHLIRLVTPPGGLVLDPFAGSGTTGVACAEEGARCVLIERDPEHASTCRARVEHAYASPVLFGGGA
jgi:predicted RNA methylase